MRVRSSAIAPHGQRDQVNAQAASRRPAQDADFRPPGEVRAAGRHAQIGAPRRVPQLRGSMARFRRPPAASPSTLASPARWLRHARRNTGTTAPWQRRLARYSPARGRRYRRSRRARDCRSPYKSRTEVRCRGRRNARAQCLAQTCAATAEHTSTRPSDENDERHPSSECKRTRRIAHPHTPMGRAPQIFGRALVAHLCHIAPEQLRRARQRGLAAE